MNWIPNPYSSTKQEEAKETPIKLGVSDYVIFIFFIFFATYGMASFLEDRKIIDRNWKHFWFEKDLKRWIHGESEVKRIKI
jgi:hypothetical protein